MALPPFITGGIQTGIGSAVGGLIGRAASGLFGDSRAEANRDSILNTNEFLTGTIGAKIATDKQYMDTIYPGTSPWERLGSSPGSGLQATDPGTSREAALLPLTIASMQNATQQSVAKTQTDAQKAIAKMNNETLLEKTVLDNTQSAANVNLQTAGGELPKTQAAVQAATKVLTEAQTTGVRTDNVVKQYATFLSHMPVSVIQHEWGQQSESIGWKPLMEAMAGAMGDATGTVNKTTAIEDALKKIPSDKWPKLEADIRKAATTVATAQEASIRNYLGAGKRVIDDDITPFLQRLFQQ